MQGSDLCCVHLDINGTKKGESFDSPFSILLKFVSLHSALFDTRFFTCKAT